MQRNFYEKFIGHFAPQKALRNYTARLALHSLEKRNFEAASKGRRTDGWRTPSTDANSAFMGKLQIMRDRSRDLVRNNSHASRAIDVITKNVIGKGVRGEPIGRSKTQTKKITQAWEAFVRSKKCDYSEKNKFYGLQRLAMRTVAESGGVLIRRRKISSSKRLVVPMQIELLEPDFIDLTKNETIGSNKIIQGCEYDASNKLVAYWLYDEHPGNVTSWRSIKSHRVSSEDVIYMFHAERIGQVHGLPRGLSTFIRLRDFDEYEDAQLMRQKIAACFTAFVYDSSTHNDGTGLGGGSTEGDHSLAEEFEPGAIEILPPGKDIKLASPPGVQNYSEYASVTRHAIAAGFGVPYEALTSDYSQVNFSSARMTWIQFGRDLDDWQEHMLIPQMLDTIYEWFLEALDIATPIDTKGARIKWITPRRAQVDPTKEIPAQIKAIRGGLTSQRRALWELGLNPDEIYQEIETDHQILDDKGIILDTDPRKVAAGGTIQSQKTVEDVENEQKDS